MLVKFSTLRGGVWIEVTGSYEHQPGDRCFRFDSKGNAEYCYYADAISSNPAPRWYGHIFKQSEFTFA